MKEILYLVGVAFIGLAILFLILASNTTLTIRSWTPTNVATQQSYRVYSPDREDLCSDLRTIRGDITKMRQRAERVIKWTQELEARENAVRAMIRGLREDVKGYSGCTDCIEKGLKK